ncbi:exoenzyme S synthesis regulatory protein ExsA [Arenibacter sp. NBRC 103722]|uniref:helix-turn-helix domain-containing protein n=1 Tax=Arenibacter sp. NBRC 103722 TaxID=1113929 RepID=UPI0008536BAB|nr:AraC family transcriptional regulator [Arenibacter sp. NBRC 103722]GBF19171.1 exoenzyme S synthesis regulatory protein ExsA [Arenibacter sp. NBRC 103722]|tara:strand:- start:1453 stop:2310 length:858 start_codon:yes stop_codon:yes gene_type:complete
MNNIQDFIAYSNMFRIFKVDELLFAEFKCPVEASSDNVWCDNNFFAFILTGETLVKTSQNQYPMLAGDCVFAKKGSILIESEYQEDFCELMVFVPDDFIRSVMIKYKFPLDSDSTESCDAIYPFGSDEVLQAYFHSLLAYFNQPKPPANSLLKLKFEELIVSILSTNKHQPLKCYFQEIAKSTRPSIKQIMEDNFIYNLSISEFARLCARSLSSFKSEFKNVYNTTPGKWLLGKRLEHSKYLIDTTDQTLDAVYLNSGFENKSHFTSSFKTKYGYPPGQYKSQKS